MNKLFVFFNTYYFVDILFWYEINTMYIYFKGYIYTLIYVSKLFSQTTIYRPYGTCTMYSLNLTNINNSRCLISNPNL